MKFLIFILLIFTFIRLIPLYLEYRKSDLMHKNFWSFLTKNTDISKHTDKDLFKNSRYSHTDVFEGLILDDFDFSNSKFIDVDFKGSSLKRANFNNCELKDCDFRKADLKDATFVGADVKPRGLILKIYTKTIEILVMSALMLASFFIFFKLIQFFLIE